MADTEQNEFQIQNEQRADRGDKLVGFLIDNILPGEYSDEVGDEAPFHDAIAEIMHAAERKGLSGLEVVRVATMHFEAEMLQAETGEPQ